MLRLMLVDDHNLFRDGLRMVLGRYDDLEVVAEAADARQALAAADASRPDVVVLDVSLPGMDGVQAARELQRRQPAARLLVVSMHEREEDVARALAAGVRGYAFKSQRSDEVVEAIRAVGRGEQYVPPTVSRFVLDELLRAGAVGGPLAALSQREREVCHLLVRGLGNDAIAQQLCISVKTVETHRARILKKLRVHSIADLIRLAARHGLALD